MPLISFNPLLWDWSSLARFNVSIDQSPKPYISDKIARDIGLDAATLEELRREWPSQSKDRPLI